jgi:hypothetical protein
MTAIDQSKLEAIQARRASLAESKTQAPELEQDERAAATGSNDDTFARAAESQQLGELTANMHETVRDDDFKDVLGVYLSVVEHQPQLVLHDEEGHPIMVPFVNHTLIVRSQHIHTQIERNMQQNPVYRSQMTRCSPEQARMILETIKRTQREIATTGPVSTPLVRAVEAIRANTLATAKQEIMDKVN